MKEDVAEFLDAFYGFRKIIAFIAVFVTGVVLRVKGYIAGTDLTSIVNTTFVAFAAGNSVEHFTSAVKEYMGNKNTSVAAIAKDIVQSTEGNS